MNNLYTTREVATALKCSVRTVQAYVANGTIAARRVGNLLRIHQLEVERLTAPVEVSSKSLQIAESISASAVRLNKRDKERMQHG